MHYQRELSNDSITVQLLEHADVTRIMRGLEGGMGGDRDGSGGGGGGRERERERVRERERERERE